MKFSNSLKFNAVAEWWEEYIAYSALKKQIYQFEKQHTDWTRSGDDLEANQPLMGPASTNEAFTALLDRELTKIKSFYETQEKELLDELEDLSELVIQKETESLASRSYSAPSVDEDDEDDEDEDEPMDLPFDNDLNTPVSPRMKRQVSANSGKRTRIIEPPKQSFPHDRRSSVSSSDNADLEASLSSLRNASTERRKRADSVVSTSSRGGKRRASLGHILSLVVPSSSTASNSVQGAPGTVWTSNSDYATDVRLLFKRRITQLYIHLTSLKSYVELNHSGFRKILKKYDKVTLNELKDQYLHEVVESAYPFLQSSRDRLSDGIARLIAMYAKCVTRGDHSAALRQLRVNQREQIAWERDTVWRQMIGKERRGESDGQVKTIGVIEDELRVARSRFKKKHIFMLLAVVVFVILLNVRMMDQVEANNCTAILVFATILWATEAIPLFVTSILVPLLLVCFRVVRSDTTHERLSTPDATKYIFSAMFSPTIMLLIGGFTIASALSKTSIDRILITRVLSLAGNKPRTVLLYFMGVACFASMWISNVAAPTLCFSLIQPILRTLPPKARFAPCLIIGIALAANIGGQCSPISSPQNLIALGYMEPAVSWPQWFAVSIPVAMVSIFLIWLLLLASYRPGTTIDGEALEIKPIRAAREPFTLKQYWVTFVCIVTIALWCAENSIKDLVGDMGVIAIIPIVAFFSTGVLKKDDFEQFLWTIVFIAMGGIALGKAVTSSGLLEVMDHGIRRLISGLTLYTVVVVLSCVILVISTFISHTIAAVLLVPIAAEVGENMNVPHPRLLIFITALVCSTGMGMPVSGFPNQTAATQEDEMGQLYLSNVDFLKNGVPASIIATIVVFTIGFLIMQGLGL
ncbi:SPX-domain-containing protein [Sistotremastrum suecicum HHB10207 ss-3]|uniref:SPX-domain-containing protein n=1 Tax=Sistotremastrum suecicum HHB10207 ss-3 TaxID=1314776 RepID=A0A166FBA3_9AGAM|nr:SPX-domain-containing protein [Sistotremastrum suecicum HHB10207 ss-3]